ncbi:unnamed protein product [Orchesella dallaii]|uniref:Uncharacterized protein n=1 Tax=Orchesella dallaii TaxID=48710 RepID=A0ABP1QIN8_9HEXA
MLFVTLGCLIFRGVEKRSLTLLKWSATGFTTLQVLVFTVILILYFVSPDGEWSYSQAEKLPLEKLIMRISIYFLSLVATTNYIIVLILYIRKLWKPKPGHKPDTGIGTNSVNNVTPQISSPISQPLTHYYRRQLQNDGYPAMPYRRQQPQQPTTPRYIQKQHNPAVYESVLDSPTSRRDSLNSQCQPFYPANFYSASMTRGVPPSGSPSNMNANIEAIYNQSQASTTSFMHRYPYPHERHRFPLDSPRPQDGRGFRSPQPQQQGEVKYQQPIYGGSIRGHPGTPNGYDQSAEPLLHRPNEA